jgi:hypothetical protein
VSDFFMNHSTESQNTNLFQQRSCLILELLQLGMGPISFRDQLIAVSHGVVCISPGLIALFGGELSGLEHGVALLRHPLGGVDVSAGCELEAGHVFRLEY